MIFKGQEGHLDYLTLEDGPIGCPETLVRNYHSTMCKIPEERRSRIVTGFKINVVTYHLILGNDLNAVEPKLDVYLKIVSPVVSITY